MQSMNELCIIISQTAILFAQNLENKLLKDDTRISKYYKQNKQVNT